MTDKPPARFAPEGARYKKSDWQPDGSPADQQKRTYLDRIGDLEETIRKLQYEVETSNTQIASLESILSHAAQKDKSLTDQNLKQHRELERLIKLGDASRYEEASNTIATLQAELKTWEQEFGATSLKLALAEGSNAERETALTKARKTAAGQRWRVTAVAILGVAGTIWGSLGNPLPSSSSAVSKPESVQKSAEELETERVQRISQQQTACVLKERKQGCTRSFGKAITSWDPMREAVATYAARAGEKLRRFGLSAGAMQVFLRTNEHNNDPKYANQATFAIEATADSRALIAAAVNAASLMWRDGYRYAKAGIVLLDLYRQEEMPAADMFATRDPDKSAKVMAALDALNERFGRNAVRPGGLVAKPAAWSMRRGNLSPCYTTRIEDVMQAKA